jgi:hypothetical protein
MKRVLFLCLGVLFLASLVAAQDTFESPQFQPNLAGIENQEAVTPGPNSITCGEVDTCNTQYAVHVINNYTGATGVAFWGDNTKAGTGVLGSSSSGPGVQALSSTGTGLMIGAFSGNMITACNSSCFGNVFRVDHVGKVFADGGYQTGGADVAEFIRSHEKPEAGDVVEIDPRHPGEFRLSSTPNSASVAGVVSEAPGLTMNAKGSVDQEMSGPRLALVGRLMVKASAENGAIRPGDMLVASATRGHAMRASAQPAPGTVIGKALGELDLGTGTIEMMVWSR